MDTTSACVIAGVNVSSRGLRELYQSQSKIVQRLTKILAHLTTFFKERHFAVLFKKNQNL